MAIGHSNLSIFSMEIFSSQDTLGCVRVTIEINQYTIHSPPSVVTLSCLLNCLDFCPRKDYHCH